MQKLLGETLAQIKLASGVFAPIGWDSKLRLCALALKWAGRKSNQR